MKIAQRCRMLWSRQSHLPLNSSPHTSKTRDLSRCQRTIEVTVRVNIYVVVSAVHIGRLVANTHVVHLFCELAHRTDQNSELPRTPTETLTKSALELFKHLSSNASDEEFVHASGYQSARGPETFRRKTPDRRIRPGSPSPPPPRHGCQEPVNREPQTLWCIAKFEHSLRKFHCGSLGCAHGACECI